MAKVIIIDINPESKMTELSLMLYEMENILVRVYEDEAIRDLQPNTLVTIFSTLQPQCLSWYVGTRIDAKDYKTVLEWILARTDINQNSIKLYNGGLITLWDMIKNELIRA